ncbi:penicillin acylase family protein [Streptomyces hirsutus]
MRLRPRRSAVAAVTLSTMGATLPAVAAEQPDRQEHPSHRGLSAVVRYTEHGIPHIVAKDHANLGFGNGWAQAADQVCTLADGFVTVRGDRSRFFGPDAAPDYSLSSAGTNLSSDLYFRGVREAGTVEKLLARPAPSGPSRSVKELMRGFAAGYNAWLKQNRITDPACRNADWVRPVTTLDVAARGFAIAVLGGEGRTVDAITAARPPASAGPDAAEGPGSSASPGSAGTSEAGGTTGTAPSPSPEEAARAARELFAADRADMGSNAVAFSGEATANGRGLLLGNPHYPWQGGRRFWQSQQTIPGELNVAGGSLLGTVTVSIGHNAHMAWSHTVATGVTLNLHQLTLDPADPTVYLVDGRRERMRKRTVTVPVANGAPVTRSQWWTRYGPVVTSLGASLPLPWTGSTAYALNDPNAANLRASDTGLGFSKARSTRDVLDTLRHTQGLPWVNTVAADSRGHSLFTQSQVLPRITDELAQRCSTALGQVTYPSSGLAVLDGSRGDCALGRDRDAVQPGIFGQSRMPTLKDAPYAENSNDSAWLSNADRPLTGYERVFGTIGTQRSMRTRGAVEDVAAMADRGGLTVRDLERQQFADRVPAAALAGDDVAKACAALPGGTARGTDGREVDVGSRVPCSPGGTAPWTPAAGAHCSSTGSGGGSRRRSRGRGCGRCRSRPPIRSAPRAVDTSVPAFATALADTVAELRAAGIALGSRLGEHQFVERGGKRIAVPGAGVAGRLEQGRGAVGPGPRVHGGVDRVQLRPGRRLGRRRLPGGSDAADVLPVVEPELAVFQRPDTAVLR